jgi:hypothetical protein
MAKLKRVIYGKDNWSKWFVPRSNKGRAIVYRIICCDCGLAHDFEFRATEVEVEFRMRPNEHSTSQVRRYIGKKDDCADS